MGRSIIHAWPDVGSGSYDDTEGEEGEDTRKSVASFRSTEVSNVYI